MRRLRVSLTVLVPLACLVAIGWSFPPPTSAVHLDLARQYAEYTTRAGAPTGGDRVLKAFLNAGLAVRASDVRDFDRAIGEPHAVWLYSEDRFGGELRQFRGAVESLPEPLTVRSIRVGSGSYVQVYPEPGLRGEPFVTYTGLESIGSNGVTVASMLSKTTASITATAIQNTDLQANPNAPKGIAGYYFTVALDDLDLDIAVKEEDSSCSSRPPDSCNLPKQTLWTKAFPILAAPNGQNPTSTWTQIKGKKWLMQLMVNGTYFYKCPGSKATYETAYCLQTNGPVIRDGDTVLSKGLEPYASDVLAFTKDPTGALYTGEYLKANGGLPDIFELAIPGNYFMIDSGYQTDCTTECHEAGSQQPRTAIGFNSDDAFPDATSTMYVVVIQAGRDESGNNPNPQMPGVTANRLATYMAGLGVQQGFMLDGGGSSTFYMVDSTQPGGALVSVPGDTYTIGSETYPVYRPVTTVFGIRGLK